jgi:hypothetical protein
MVHLKVKLVGLEFKQLKLLLNLRMHQIHNHFLLILQINKYGSTSKKVAQQTTPRHHSADG